MGFLFELRNVCESFALSNEKSLAILNDLNFELPSEGLFCIFGKSGCGKSTLLNIMEGLMKPTKGEVLYLGKDITKFKEKEKNEYLNQEIGIVFQSYNLINSFTTYENLKLTAKIKGIKDLKIIDKYLKDFNLEETRNKEVSFLSGGEKQRISIIRALLNNPKVVFADEPTGNLDETNTKIVMDILKEVSKERLVIVVSHNKELVDTYNDGFLDLTNGTQFYYQPIHKEDTKSLVFNNNKHGNYVSLMLKNNFKKNFKKDILSFLASFFAILVVVLSIGFSNGIKNNTLSLYSKFQNYNSYQVSYILYETINDSSLKLQKTERPEEEELYKVFKDYKNYDIYNNYDYYFSGEKVSKINGTVIDGISYIPCNNLSNSNAVYVNDAFKELYSKSLKGSCLNKFITLNLTKNISYNNLDSSGPNILTDIMKLNLKFSIEKIIYEFGYLNYPKVYYSINYFETYIKKLKANNISKETGRKITYFDLVNDAKNNEEISSYSYHLFLDNIKDCNSLNMKLEAFDKYKITNEVFTTLDSFKTLSSSLFDGLIFFVVISAICSVSIIGFLSFSSFVFNQKQSAILTILGAETTSIYFIYIIEQLLLTLFSLITLFITLPYICDGLNAFIYQNIKFDGIIDISFLNIRSGIFISIISLFIVFLFVYVPLFFSKKKQIYKELKEE